MTNFKDDQDNGDHKNSNNSISRIKKSFFVSTIFLNSNNTSNSRKNNGPAAGIIRSRSSNDIELKSDDVNPSPDTDVDLKMAEHPVEKKDNNMKQTSKSSSTFQAS